MLDRLELAEGQPSEGEIESKAVRGTLEISSRQVKSRQVRLVDMEEMCWSVVTLF